PDRYESASADVALQSDPLTNNRYAFGAGNPIGNIEFDGHGPCGDRMCPLPPAEAAEQRERERQQRAARARAAEDEAVREGVRRSKRTGDPYKVAYHGGSRWVTPTTCIDDRECFMNTTTRAAKWQQTPSGDLARTAGQLEGANYAHRPSPGRVQRQMAANELAKKSPQALRGQGRENLLAKFRSDPLYEGVIADNAAAFAPDNSSVLDDVGNGVVGGVGSIVGGVADLIDATGVDVPKAAKAGSRFAGGAPIFMGQFFGGDGLIESLVRGGGSVLSGSVVFIGCTLGTVGMGVVTGTCPAASVVGGVALDQFLTQPALDLFF
ncbi:MAG: hypothetical protein Q8O56_07615, partial [Solirubrobacteraceae bacterium]|nr:hypothetical protein [Solirubrobacteraceae bacterium]